MQKPVKNWLSLVNNCVYYACQSHEIYRAPPYSVDFKAPGELWDPLRQYLVNMVLLDKGPVNICNDYKAEK